MTRRTRALREAYNLAMALLLLLAAVGVYVAAAAL